MREYFLAGEAVSRNSSCLSHLEHLKPGEAVSCHGSLLRLREFSHPRGVVLQLARFSAGAPSPRGGGFVSRLTYHVSNVIAPSRRLRNTARVFQRANIPTPMRRFRFIALVYRRSNVMAPRRGIRIIDCACGSANSFTRGRRFTRSYIVCVIGRILAPRESSVASQFMCIRVRKSSL